MLRDSAKACGEYAQILRENKQVLEKIFINTRKIAKITQTKLPRRHVPGV